MMQDLLPSFLSPPLPFFFFFLHPKPFEHELLNKEVGSINRLCDSFAKNELFRRRAIQHWRIWYSFCPSHTMMVFCSLVDVFLDWILFPLSPCFFYSRVRKLNNTLRFPGNEDIIVCRSSCRSRKLDRYINSLLLISFTLYNGTNK